MASTSVTNPATVQLCEADIVNALLTWSFSVRPTVKQNIIVNERPTTNLTIRNKGRSFMREWYSKKDWPCGSSVLEKLFFKMFRNELSLSLMLIIYFVFNI